MYIHTLTCFCEYQRRFPLFSPLNILHTLFFLSALSVPSLLPCLLLRSPGARPSVILSPPSLPSLRLSSAPAVCCVCRGCCVCPVVSPSVSPSPWLVPCVCLLRVRAPEALRRPSVCPAVCRAAAVTRQPSGARQYGSVGRCTVYMSPALSPLAYVLPCVPLLVPCVCLCLCAAAVCRLVAIIGGTPLYPGRRRCGAVFAM